ncbi:1-(5-phosphoribosyl)-5-[(5-phosphoribosylamino)methylideneamino] imidazole-4-carboxamide isomerase [Hydrogenivirga caldilitoris]|uniref:1-(5-phosphoribosyl)-5-[(5-phosphoribosylamino)methylideneamino] imidazole-4-carboxamide isomerase n=1 Tax=Hydrogenivirga caldilitoris TaxID=246264 RepID=A0A497XS14_9AQUI|nr:1-(5-phosphoribosyl)-5-[(5-phosphoribosylamino)methylideneamino]imidazole-4-carboxamide isomerase [Hydrogenivirga caldilitoris]RLJ70950.1 1-(5-phosphoribosyl)-5-[(5-phosphoribosylamino)methylideneamino] imidazole-4-carboxamide isomerase [Hydrogenivirga caldilitoris]
MDIKSFVIPAIDIKEGKVIRLFRGEFDKAKVYPYIPEELAGIFGAAGFKRIHLVDLDGAEGGKPKNIQHIKRVRAVFNGEIEFGGGVRSYGLAKALFDEGIDYVVIGTLALKDPDEFERIILDFPGKVILSIDSKEGKVAVGGWREESSTTPEELASAYDSKPIWGYLYTIIERDGSLEGVDVKPYREIKSVVKKPVLASGGVSSLEDVEKLYGVVDGVVVGKAIYEGRIPVEGF